MINLIKSSEIPNDTSKGLKYKKISLFIVKKNEEVFLYLNRCPHLGTPLHDELHGRIRANGQFRRRGGTFTQL